MQRIKILDSMRGFAASIVVFHHVYTRFAFLYSNNEPAYLHRALSFISDLNVEAVLLFFVLSGFSIRLSLQKGLPVSKKLFNEYVYKRLKRILPLYYVAIIFTAVSGFITEAIYTNDDFSIKNLLGNIFFLQCSKSYKGNWFAPYGDNGPLWSLSFEMFYYFFFPVFILLMLRFFKSSIITEKTNRIILVVTLLFSLLCIIINNFIFFPYIAFAALFYVWYCGFYLAEIHIKKKIALNNNFIISVVILLLIGILLYLRSSAEFYKLFFASAITTGFFIIYMLRQKNKKIFYDYFDKVFNFFFYHLGKGSYALYLLHYPLILILKNFKQINIAEAITSIILFAFFCTWLEQYFVKKKWLFLKIRYIR
jgi:peptidoglycan/LPS O-acetylase OafA/YrhL